MTALCRRCNQIINSTPIPVGAPIPNSIAEDRRESFRAWAGLSMTVGRHMSAFHGEVIEAAGFQASRVLPAILFAEVESTDPEFVYWLATLHAEIESVLRELIKPKEILA